MSKPRNRLPEPPPQPPEPKPASNGPLPEPPKPEAPKLRNALQELKRPAPCCFNCLCFHRSTNAMLGDTCRYNEAQKANTEAYGRAWPHVLPTDVCWRHPELRARYLAAVQAELERLQSLPGAPGGVLGALDAKSAV